ncbi:MAG: heterodisulfide reductase-related iron-sulfur binding cluster [Myxococcales bacterium]|nr:heterodisulfide reductase-related iron-sulfur binding cluster [Myxococcales bacterium]
MFDPNDERYWDPRDLEQELQRAFTICHGCRMCVGYCPSFPDLFARVDGYVERRGEEIEAFDDADYRAVNDLCYQCKLCYFKCPYTPDEDHPFQLDFPRLMLRHRAQRARRDGIPLQDRILGEPQLLGRMGCGLASGPANFVSEQRLLRKAQEVVTGISADFLLPPFAKQPLREWMRRREPAPEGGTKGELALFSTCTVDFNLPAAGRAAVQVLEHQGYSIVFPEEQTCCGMPNLDGGDVEAATEKAERNIAALLPFARAGKRIVVPGPTCSYVIKKDYPELLGGREDALLVAEQTRDLMEFLRDELRAKALRLDFERGLGEVAYHVPCHLRAQKVGFPAWQLLGKIPETRVTRIEECSAVDGTWGMKAQYYELGRKYAAKLIREVRAVPYDHIATDCPLSGRRLEKELGAPALHPIELLNLAYGLPPVTEPNP